MVKATFVSFQAVSLINTRAYYEILCFPVRYFVFNFVDRTKRSSSLSCATGTKNLIDNLINFHSEAPGGRLSSK